MEYLQNLIEELQDTLNIGILEKFESPSDLHYLAQHWPWETREEIEIIRLICESGSCSKATAMMLFWRARPQDYTGYFLGEKLPYNNGVFELIQTILKGFEEEKYQHYAIHYDPVVDMPDMDRTIDDKMKLAVLGEETWCDEEYIKEIMWYVPSELESELKRCNDKDYLHMIANAVADFRDVAKLGELVMQNPCCDKGTALLLYWRLLRFYYDCGFSPKEAEVQIPVITRLREDFLLGRYHDGIAYAPMKDKKNAALLGQEKAKWKIPEYMKEPV
jgi:hypothetical protein